MSLFGSGMSYGHSHGNANLPLVLAGGSDIGLKHGSHVDFNQGHFKGYQLDKPGEHYSLCSRPANPNAHMSNLLLLMAQRMGVETDKFGDSNKVIARAFDLSPHTVKRHVANILDKLALQSRGQAAAWLRANPRTSSP